MLVHRRGHLSARPSPERTPRKLLQPPLPPSFRRTAAHSHDGAKLLHSGRCGSVAEPTSAAARSEARRSLLNITPPPTRFFQDLLTNILPPMGAAGWRYCQLWQDGVVSVRGWPLALELVN